MKARTVTREGGLKVKLGDEPRERGRVYLRRAKAVLELSRIFKKKKRKKKKKRSLTGLHESQAFKLDLTWSPAANPEAAAGPAVQSVVCVGGRCSEHKCYITLRACC